MSIQSQVVVGKSHTAVLLLTPGGFHIPTVYPKSRFPYFLAQFFKLNEKMSAQSRLQTGINPLRLTFLRALFELEETLRIHAGKDAGRLSGFTMNDIMEKLASTRFQLMLDAFPQEEQWAIQHAGRRKTLISIELHFAETNNLVKKLIVAGKPSYTLTPQGRELARLLFAPDKRFQVTRIPSSLTRGKVMPYPVNTLSICQKRAGYYQYFPTGTLTFEGASWKGEKSVLRLFRHLM